MANAGEPKTSSKAERRERDREITRARAAELSKKAAQNRRNRRLLITGIIAGTATIALGGLAVVGPRRTAPGIDQSGDLPQQISKYNSELSGNPQKIEEIGPYLIEAGYKTLGRELGIDTSRLSGKYTISQRDTYRNISDKLMGCSAITLAPLSEATTEPFSEYAHYNSTGIAFQEGQRPSTNAAYNAFRLGIHEGHHQLARLVDVNPHIPTQVDVAPNSQSSTMTTAIVDIVKARGLLKFPRYPMFDLPTRECFGVIDSNREEGYVEASTLIIMHKIGFTNAIPARFYADVTKAINQGLIATLFPTDFRSLMPFYLETDFEGFYKRVGERLKAHPTLASKTEIQSMNPQILAENYFKSAIPLLPQ